VGGKPSRDKGARFERQVVHTLSDAGIQAERVPLSGAAHGSFGGDVRCDLPGHEAALLECKKRARGFKQIYGWLDENTGLVIGADRLPPLIVLPLDTFLSMLSDEDNR